MQLLAVQEHVFVRVTMLEYDRVSLLYKITVNEDVIDLQSFKVTQILTIMQLNNKCSIISD